MLRRSVDRRLNGRAVVGYSVAVYRKAVRRQINCLRILEPHRIVRHRLRPHRVANYHSNKQEEPNTDLIHGILQPSAQPRAGLEGGYLRNRPAYSWSTKRWSKWSSVA